MRRPGDGSGLDDLIRECNADRTEIRVRLTKELRAMEEHAARLQKDAHAVRAILDYLDAEARFEMRSSPRFPDDEAAP